MDKLRVLIIMGLLAVAMTVGAKSFQVGDITYATTSVATCKVKKFNKKSNATDVVIPNTISFEGRDYAVTEIDSKVFMEANSITAITIPENMVKIGSQAFMMCTNLRKLTYNARNCEFEEWKYFGMLMSSSSDTRLIYSNQFVGSPIYDVIIGPNVEVIPEKFLSRCGQAYISLPPSVKRIKKNAFFGCTSLAKVDGLHSEIVVEDGVFDGTAFYGQYLAMKKTGFKQNDNYVDSIPSPQSVQQNTVAQQPMAKQQQPATTAIVNPDAVDIDIPSGTSSLENTFAVIIGNENYHKVDHVQFAVNDAQIFAKYCEKTLGLPAENIYCYTDATLGTMMEAVKRVVKIAKVYNGDIDIIFYYSGHGIPNEMSKQAFLLPIDANGEFTESCYSLASIYKELGETGARKISVFLDACFSGAKRDNGMIVQSRGAVIKPKQDMAYGNMVIFSAATNEQTAYPYKQKKHGLFTYYLLKKLQETKGNVTYGELDRFLLDQVSRRSVVANGREQNPSVAASESFDKIWQNMTVK